MLERIKDLAKDKSVQKGVLGVGLVGLVGLVVKRLHNSVDEDEYVEVEYEDITEEMNEDLEEEEA